MSSRKNSRDLGRYNLNDAIIKIAETNRILAEIVEEMTILLLEHITVQEFNDIFADKLNKVKEFDK